MCKDLRNLFTESWKRLEATVGKHLKDRKDREKNVVIVW